MDNALKSAIVAGVIVLRSPEGNRTFRVPPSTEEYKRVNQRLTRVPSRRNRHTPSRFMLKKTEQLELHQCGMHYFLTAPNATDSIVCIRSWESSPSPCCGVVMTPRFPTNCPPAKVQNLTCLTPHVTNWLSESGLNSATKILSVWPCELASLVPVRLQRKRNSEFKRLKKTSWLFHDFWLWIIKNWIQNSSVS